MNCCPPLRGGTIHRAYRVRLFNAVKLSILTWDSMEKEHFLDSNYSAWGRKWIRVISKEGWSVTAVNFLTFTQYSKKTFAGHKNESFWILKLQAPKYYVCIFLMHRYCLWLMLLFILLQLSKIPPVAGESLVKDHNLNLSGSLPLVEYHSHAMRIKFKFYLKRWRSYHCSLHCYQAESPRF